jgi:DNA-binding NarL/FixJ family response regulator
MEPADVVDAVRIVVGGDALLAPRLTRRLIEAFVVGAGRPEPDTTQLEELTPREHQVLALVGQDLSNAEIDDRLVLSALTAKTHVARLFVKLGARDRAQLVVTACETALVTRASEADASCRQGAGQSECREEACVSERRDVLDLVAAEVEDLD